MRELDWGVSRKELAAGAAARLGCTASHADQVIAAFFDEAATVLARGDKVNIRGFGAFTRRTTGPRTARRPDTGEPVHVPSKATVSFRPAVTLRTTLNRSTR